MSWVEKAKEYFSSGKLVAQAESIGFTSSRRELFQDLSFVAKTGEVTAVTGKSGSGKTTLLKIIAGIEIPSDGSFKIYTDNIGYLPQNPDEIQISDRVPIGELFMNQSGLNDLASKIKNFENVIQNHPDRYASISEEYGEVLEAFQSAGGYQVEADVNHILTGLNVNESRSRNINLNTKLAEVSSGQKRKILLGMALYSSPQLLLLDDPTSHLDTSSVKWLVQYLRNSKSSVVIATNHESFIDQVANQTIGFTDTGRTFVFSGGYREFTKKRDALIDAERLEANSVKGKLDQLRTTDAMFKSKNVYKRSADMAKVGRALHSRIDRLDEKYQELPGSTNNYETESVPNLVFKSERRSGQDVLTIDGVSKSYSRDHKVVDLSGKRISIRRGEKWLFWGANGSGKSTLVKTITDTINGGSFLPERGNISFGSNVKLGYLSPEVSYIPDNGNIVETMYGLFYGQGRGKVTSVLRFFGFSGEQINRKDISMLSSGEVKRLNLAYLMLSEPNLLILDEPTGDYLSEELKNRLAKSLRSYDGTLILVSHDREFVDKTSIDHILEIPLGNVRIV